MPGRNPSLIAILATSLAITAVAQTPSSGPQPAAGAADLAKQSQNPVSSLISVPIQNNDNFGIGPYSRIQNVLNIQPSSPSRQPATST